MEENKQNLQIGNVSQAILGADDKGRVSYKVNGEEVNLSFNIVRRFLTRGNGNVSDAEVVMFISLCRTNLLNPFIGDCYLIKYDDRSPATMVTARDAFMRRAESAQGIYLGYQSGIIVIRDNKVIELEGAFFLPKDQLVGGWAKVYRQDRTYPAMQKVRLAEYNTGKSNWAMKPATMIQKVAEAQAFRKAFPLQTGGMYIPEEMPDEQGGTAPAAIENSEKPQFIPEKTIDPPAPEFTADPNPADFTPDPEPAPETAQGQEDGPDPALVKAGLIDPEENAEESLFRL